MEKLQPAPISDKWKKAKKEEEEEKELILKSRITTITFAMLLCHKGRPIRRKMDKPKAQ